MSTSGLGSSEPTWATKSGDKNVPYWKENIDDKITKDIRDLLQNYSGVPSEDVVGHVYATREKAWAIRSYPCTGLGIWLQPILPFTPVYSEILDLVRSGATFMDVGCFLGTDLRRLVSDISSSSAPDAGTKDQLNLYAVDIADHWSVGHFFFRDPDFPVKFVEADVLHAEESKGLAGLKGCIDVISIIHVLHQWNYETQKAACVQLARLSKGPGSIVLGFQTGTVPGTEPYSDPAAPPSYRHTPDTMRDLWNEVGEQTGTQWEVQGALWSMTATGWKEEDIKYLGKDCRLLQWVARRRA